MSFHLWCVKQVAIFCTRHNLFPRWRVQLIYYIDRLDKKVRKVRP